MTFLIVALGLGALATLLLALSHTRRTNRLLLALSPKQQLPHAVTSLFAVAELTEIARVIEHISVVHIVATILLFTLWQAAKTGTEESRVPSSERQRS